MVLSAGESAYAKIMLLVMRKTAHVIVNQDGLVSNVTIHVLLITMARTAIQNASVRMEDHVNLLMAIALVWMNGKEKFVISCVTRGPMVSTAETTVFANKIRLNDAIQ